jgi:acyl-CoA synthetase (AMP-forming)/AMP-acid ligase II
VPEVTLNRPFRSSFPDYEETGFRTRAWLEGKARVAEELRPLHKTVLHAFAAAARLETEIGITLLPEREGRPVEHRSYRQLYHDARQVAGILHERGVAQGDRVLLVFRTSHDFVAAFLGAQLLQAVPVPAYPPSALNIDTGVERLAHIAVHSGAKACLTERRILPVLGELGLRAPAIEHVVSLEDHRGAGRLQAKFRADADDLAFLQYTSGSTGQPKGVALSHGNLVANIHAIGQACEIRREDVMVGWCPLYHDMGLIGTLLLSIYWRLPLVLMAPTAFLARPVRWLRAISEHRGTLSPSPNFGFAMAVKRVPAEERAGLDLSSWRLAFNGAESVNMRTLRDFQEAYGPFGFREEAMLPVYGMAEASLAVTFPEPGARVRFEVVDRRQLANGRAVPGRGVGSMSVVSVGRQVPGHSVLVVDEQGQFLPDREVGHVVVSGPSIMQGYFGDEAATARVLRNGWLWTGDLGYFANGELYITGRAKDLVIVRGCNYYAEDIERAAERATGVRPGGCVAFGVYDEESASDLVVLVCETRLAGADERLDLVKRVGDAVGKDTGLTVDEVVLVDPGAVPKTSSGKRQRALCRQQYLEGELAPRRTGKLRMGVVFARSQAGFLLMQARRLIGRRREPE